MLSSFAINALSTKNVFLLALPDTIRSYRSQSVSINVLFNDVVQGTILVTIASSPAYGTVVVEPNNTVTYTNNGNISNSDSFTYTISNGISESTASVSITISDAPVGGGEAVAFAISALSAAPVNNNTGEGACELTINTTKYYDGTEPYPTLADIIYNDAGKTTVFNGGDRYYAIDGGKTIRIISTGEITDVWLCGGGNQ